MSVWDLLSVLFQTGPQLTGETQEEEERRREQQRTHKRAERKQIQGRKRRRKPGKRAKRNCDMLESDRQTGKEREKASGR